MLDDIRARAQNEEKTNVTDNKTIIECALDCAKEKVRPKVIVGKINHAQLWKKTFFYARLRK